MTEYFIVANSFAAPFCSDTSEEFIEAADPRAALEQFAARYNHPAGLYAANCFRDANAKAKGEAPLARWWSNRVRAEHEATKGLGSYSFRGISAEAFEVDGKRFTVDDPKGGSVIEESPR